MSLALAAAASVTACSFALDRPSRESPKRCDAGDHRGLRLAASLDLIWTAGWLTLAGFGFAARCDDDDPCIISPSVLIIPAALLAIGFTASATYGWRRSAGCRADAE